MTATTLKGLEGVLAEELKKLGAQDIKEGIRSVTYRGDNGFLYKSNIALRTAIRILKPIRTCKIYDEEDLYEALQKIKWEKYLDVEGTFAIAAVGCILSIVCLIIRSSCNSLGYTFLLANQRESHGLFIPNLKDTGETFCPIIGPPQFCRFV